MGFTIHRNVPRSEIRGRVPTRFSSILPPGANLPDACDLIVFSDSVVKSSMVRKAIKRQKASENAEKSEVMLFGQNFTEDCWKWFEGDRFLLFSALDFHWTDRRYEFIRGLSASRVKAPGLQERTD